MMDSHTVYIGIGTNIEPREERMEAAIAALSQRWIIVATSSIHETAPVGYIDQPNFLNAVVALSTSDAPHDLHRELKALEQSLGRQQRERWHEREIDFDILIYSDLILNDDGLTIPHSELHKRSFVLIPLAEIAPEFVHPILGQDIRTLLVLQDSHSDEESERPKSRKISDE